MTKQEQDILHEYKETVCVFVRISFNPFLQCTLEESEKVFYQLFTAASW